MNTWSSIATMSRAMLAMRTAVNQWREVTRQEKRVRSRHARLNRWKLKNFASLRAVLSPECVEEIAQGWLEKYKGSVIKVPRSLRPLLGATVGGLKYRIPEAPCWPADADMEKAIAELLGGSAF